MPPSSSRKIWSLFFLVLLGMILLALVFGGLSGLKRLSYGERFSLKALGPLAKGANEGGLGLKHLFRRYLILLKTAEENERLRARILELEAEVARLREEKLAYQRLAPLLKISNKWEGSTVVASIVGKPLGSWQAMVIIDKGLKDGVLPEMPVLSATPGGKGALVGQVVASEDHYAKVLLILDPSSAVDVLVQRSRQRGILRGQGKAVCLLDYVPAEADVRENDLIITSGFDGLFPKGILVGKVSRLLPGRIKGLFRPIEVRPIVDFGSLEEVIILQRRPVK